MTTTRPLSLFVRLCALATLAAQALEAQVEGRVTTSTGVAVEAARVEEVNGGGVTTTDANGDFSLPGAAPPALLLVQHPRFEDFVLEMPTLPAEALAIELTAKQTVFEEIVVSARRGGDNLSPSSIVSTVIEPIDSGVPPTTLTDAVTQVAGVSENGQGGLFQVVSIRGVSRNRVLTLVDGMRIVTERRAGAATSFLDPLLVGSVDVLRGPASTFYGSGALGGVMQVFPTTSEEAWLAAGYESNGDEGYLAGGWGGNGWSFSVAHRQAENAEAADGTELFSQFEQTSASLSKSWERGSARYQLLILPSVGRDIGKANTDFPNRPTIYPEENHLLLRFGVTTEQGWRLYAFAHPNDLETVTTRIGDRENTVENEALDFGFNAAREVSLSSWEATARVGFEYFGRAGVTARETEVDLDGTSPTTVQTTLDGSENEAAVYGSLRRRFGRVNAEVGGRFSWLAQKNATGASTDDTAFSAFGGATLPLGKGFELAANLGTGLRFASLSERFFSGTTGRGSVTGNPDLDSERSLNADLGLRWYGKKVFVAVSGFRNDIDDYIERIEVAPDQLTFVNLTSGTIEGAEIEGFYQPTQAWRLSWNAHRLEGRSDVDEALADIPTDSLQVGLWHRRGSWLFAGDLELRADKNDPGSGEIETDSAQLLSLSVSRNVSDRWSLTVSASNVLDEEYRRSADDKAPLAAGRSIGIGFRLQPGGL